MSREGIERKGKTDGPRRPPKYRSDQAGDPQYRADAVGRHGEADPRCRYDRCRERQDHRDRPRQDIDAEGATTLIDANGTTVAPGLIDSHVHPVAGDWTPRQNQIGWIDSFLPGGVTTMISPGGVPTPPPPPPLPDV